MTKSILFSTVLGAALSVGGPLLAESRVEVTAHVPFAFVAGKETLPAGEYEFILDYENAPMVLAIRSKDGKSRDILLAESQAGPRVAADSHLVFEKIGGEAYLSQVQVAGEDAKDVVPQREIMKEYAKTAANNAKNRTLVPLRKG
jgi:hypothetical protein